MRPIKFRGLPVRHEAFVVVQDEDFVYGYLCAPDEIIVWDEKKSTGKCIQVISGTVGQFIGIEDRKRTKEFPEGQEIYADDILDFTIFDFNGVDTQLRGIIKWIPDAYVYGVEYKYGNEMLAVDLSTLAADDEREVIGNIHQNPDLLEKK